MIDRIADHVNERIAQFLDNISIQLGLLAFHHELDMLLLLRGEISDKTVHLLEHPSNWDHPKRHGVALKFRGDPAQLS